MNPTKERLARDMAAQAGLVLRNVALIEDVRESRRRIVTAQDERARKLERDIHDGAQQQLVALSVQLRLAQQLVDRDPAKAQELLSDLQTQNDRDARGPPRPRARDLPAACSPTRGWQPRSRRRPVAPRSSSRSTRTASAATVRTWSPRCTSAASRPSTTWRSTPTRPASRSG